MSSLHPARPPVPQLLEGRYVRLEPVGPQHVDDLFVASTVPDAAERFAYLPGNRPTTRADVEDWVRSAMSARDVLVYAVVDKASGKAGGRQQLMRMEPEHGVIELGGIYWGPAIARTRLATEAFYLTARHIFEDLGNRRFEWKCNDRNEPSKRAALRFGFTYEGLFRQHMIVRGENRDTAWFSILDSEWPDRKARLERWLDPGNFDTDGVQKAGLGSS